MSVVFSCFCSFVLLFTLLDNVANAAFSFRPANSTCVWTEQQLRKVIEKASSKSRTTITLCKKMITISTTLNQYNRTGIDLTNRYIDLRCYLKRSIGTCTLDGRSSSRIFFGRNTDLTVTNVFFKNAKPYDCSDGGAINIGNSSLSLIGCSFMNNGNVDGGGAIYVAHSMIKINGGFKNRPVTFSYNEGDDGAALYVEKSEMSIAGYTVFSNNSGRFHGAVSLYESTFDIKNVKFVENYGLLSGSALTSHFTNSSMLNVEFIGNKGELNAVSFYGSSSLATNCTYANNKGTGIEAKYSKITLKNSTFSNNTSNEDASNIYISDDDDPLERGTFVKCESNVVFCNGLDEASIDEDSLDNTIGSFSNTDCNTEGLQPTLGQGSCPI